MNNIRLANNTLLKSRNTLALFYNSNSNYDTIKTALSYLSLHNKRYFINEIQSDKSNKYNGNLFNEELNNICKKYSIIDSINDKNEEIFITNDSNENKRLGDIIKLDDHSYGLVLQINKDNLIIGKINGKEKINTNETFTEIKNEKNIYSPFEYINYLFLKNSKLNIFNCSNKEIYKKGIIRQLYSNITFIDFFNKIKYGQKVCIIGKKGMSNIKILTSIIYENLLINSIKKNEHFFIICSNSLKSKILNFFQNLHEMFINTYKNIGSDNNNNAENALIKIYSKNYIYENVKIPDDILLINSIPNSDSKVSSYVLPILSIYNLNKYKQMYKNVILVFHDVNNYYNNILDIQNDMVELIKNYYDRDKVIRKSRSLFVTSLPFSPESVLSKYFSSSVYPYYKQGDVHTEEKNGNGDGSSSGRENGNSESCEYVLKNFKYSDLLYINEHKSYNISSSVTTFCFFNDEEETRQLKNYALSISENNIYLQKNDLSIFPDVNINYSIKNEIIETNKVWQIIKDEIRNAFCKRNNIFSLIENKKMMKIYVDHWEHEDLIHYNNIYYILAYTNFKTCNLNSFEHLVFLRILLSYNFTNKVISQKTVESFYDQFFAYYFQNLKYFSILCSDYYSNLKSFQQTKNAIRFVNNIDKVIRVIKPPFNYTT